jgi:hypothetical protein
MAISAAAIAGSATRTIIGALESHPKDRVRLARNEDMYQRALAGDLACFKHLGLMSRRVDSGNGYTFGPLNDGWTGTVPPGKKWNGKEWGWPTQKAADDAWNKYQKVAAKFGGNAGALPTSGAVPPSDPNSSGSVPQPSGLNFASAGVASGGTLVWYIVGGVALALVGKRLGWWG